MRLRLAAIALASAIADHAPAQAFWVQPDGPFQLTSRFGVGMATDPVRNRIVLFGGRNYATATDETWEWDGVIWHRVRPPVSPPARSNHAMVFDLARNRVVVFGGAGNNGVLGDLWEWDGAVWTQVTAAGPGPRANSAAAFDAQRGRTIVYGGTDANGAMVTDLHWEWNGATWTAGSNGPSPRFGSVMAHDLVRGRTVLFGGGTTCIAFQCPTLADTWEFDGFTWTQSTVNAPPARVRAAMTYDLARQRILLVGGQGNCIPACATTHGDAWEYDGLSWVLLSQGPRLHGHGLAHFASTGDNVAFGGVLSDPLVSNWPSAVTYGVRSGTWGELAPRPMPAGMIAHASAFDEARGVLVYFGNVDNRNPGTPETWLWTGGTWKPARTTPQPPSRTNHSLCYDTRRQRVVMFGGTAANGTFLNDTWEWDGANWQQRATVTSPPGQYGHTITYDERRGVTVLYPGAFGQSQLHEYDGGTWKLRTPAAAPPYRLYASLAYDRARGRTVLFGGNGSGGNLDDTWEWDGQTWTSPTPGVRPPARSYARMVYDTVHRTVVLIGGNGVSGGTLGDLWRWNGQTWSAVSAVGSPLPRSSGSVVYDTVRQRVVLFGGLASPGAGVLQDTWELHVPCETAGPGENGGGGLTCDCATLPRLGGTFCIGLTNPDPTATMQFLLLGIGPCASPATAVLPPAVCAPSLLYVVPSVVLSSTSNPATFCTQLPNSPSLVGTVLCAQGASRQANCVRAANALTVILE